MKNNLKKIREKKKITQRQLCEKVGIKFVQQYGPIEWGDKLPRIDKAIKIARALNTRVENIWF